VSEQSNVVALPGRAVEYDYAFVPEGVYDARVIGTETRVYWRTKRNPGAHKLVLWWSLCTPGFMGIVLPRYYAIPGVIGRVGRNGRYHAVRRTSHLARDLATMLDARPSGLCGPFPIELVERKLFRVSVVTVTQGVDENGSRVDLSPGAQYSRVLRVIGSGV
jgi:hypothetical protein